jgi:hypothetical protein
VESEGRTLDLFDVQWQTIPVSNASDGELAERYTALATYTVELSSSYVSGYTVTAAYTGEVHRPEDAVLRYTAIFAPLPDGIGNAPPEASDAPELTAPTGNPANDGGAPSETTATSKTSNAGLVIALVALTALLIGGAVFVYIKFIRGNFYEKPRQSKSFAPDTHPDPVAAAPAPARYPGDGS